MNKKKKKIKMTFEEILNSGEYQFNRRRQPEELQMDGIMKAL